MRNQTLNVTQLNSPPKINLKHESLIKEDEELQNSKTLNIDIPNKEYELGYLTTKRANAFSKHKPISKASKESLLTNNSKVSSFKRSNFIMIYMP